MNSERISSLKICVPKLNIFEWGMALHLIYTMIPAASVFLGGKINMLFVGLTYLGMIGCGSYFLNRLLNCLLPFALLYCLPMFYNILNSSMSMGSIISITISTGLSMAVELAPVAICYYLILNEKYEEFESILKLVLLAMTVTAITTFFGLIQNQDASRILATDIDTASEAYASIKRANIGGYYFTYTAVLIFPLIFYMKRHRFLNGLQFWVISLSFAIMVYQTSYATALLLFTSVVGLLFFMKNPTTRKLIIFCIVLGCFILFFSGFFSNVLISISRSMPSGYLSDRFYSLGKSLIGEVGVDAVGYDSFNTRRLLYLGSLKEFVTHPLFGDSLFMATQVGGHSMILDYLGMYGLLGGLVLLGMYKYIFRSIYLPAKYNECYAYMCFTFALSIILGVVNTGRFFLSMVFFPAGIYMLNREDDE